MINFKKISLVIAMAGLLICSALQAMDDYKTLLASTQRSSLSNELLGGAIQIGDKNQVQECVEKMGANVNSESIINNQLQTPLFAAIGRQNPDIVHYLVIQAHALVDLVSSQGINNPLSLTPVHYAAMIGNTTILDLVLSGQVNGEIRTVNLRDKCGNTPLHIVARQGSIENAKLLIEKGADVNAQDFFGITPLFEAASNGHIPLILYFLEHGAKTSLSNVSHIYSTIKGINSVLAYACSNGQADVVSMLLEKCEFTFKDVKESFAQLDYFIKRISDGTKIANEKIRRITTILKQMEKTLIERSKAQTMLPESQIGFLSPLSETK